MWEIKRAKRLSRALAHFVAHASLFTDHRMSSLPIRAKKNISAQFESKPVSKYSFFEVMVVKTWCRHLAQLLNRCILQIAISFNTFLRMTFHVIGPNDRFRLRFSQQSNFSVAPAEIRDANIFSVLINNNTFVRLAFTFSASQGHVVKK